MQTCTDSWRSTALTLLAAVVGLVFLLVGTAHACPHHMAAQKQAGNAVAHHERVNEPAAAKPEKVERASHSTRGSGHKAAECRMGMHDCSTCCGIGVTNAQRPQDVALVDSAPATPSVPDLPVSTLVSAITVISDPFPDRQTESLLGEAGKARLVTVSRRLRL